jgi:hypothetical protein
MDAPLNLYRASRDELIVVIQSQREQIAELEREQARLRTELAVQQAALTALQGRVGVPLAVLEPNDGETNSPGRRRCRG